MKQVEQIIAEIKDRISHYQEWIDSGYDNGEKEKRQELKELLTFIDSLTKCQQVSPVVSGDLKTIVDKEAREVWNEINTGHDYSVIDSFSQFYGICIQMAECSANWQKQQTIDKAAEWLRNSGIIRDNSGGYERECKIEEFCKAMEG